MCVIRGLHIYLVMKIEFDYRFDSSGFFDDPQRRAALERAGEIWSDIIQDDFEAIPAGAEFTTTNPTTGTSERVILDREIDDILVFVGAGSLNGSTNTASLHHNHDHSSDRYHNHNHPQSCSCSHCQVLKEQALKGQTVDLSQPGILKNTLGQANSISVDSLLAQAQINGTDLQGDIFQRRISSDFRNQGAVTDFEPWAGTISFNPSETIDWNFALNNTNGEGIDFISVALHELGHILGIGVAPIFDVLGEGNGFSGTNALATNNNNPIPLDPTLSHVAEGFNENSVLLDPLLNENRTLPSAIDLALLADIGFEIAGFSQQGFTPELATNESESIFGSNLADEIDGLLGDDSIQGNDGNDFLAGNAGHDTLFGAAGNDFLHGNEGDDSLQGGSGHDTIDGGSGSDLVVGSAGNDIVSGGAGDDELQGNEGHDTVLGGAGNDTLFGQAGADLLMGNADNDNLQGGDSNDSLQGNEGNDTLFGQAGADILEGGTGDDILLGGAGSDRFFFGLDSGHDAINDFVVAEDKIQIATALGFSNGDELLAAITSSGSNSSGNGLFSEIALDEANTLTVFHDRELQANNFEIVADSGISLDIFTVTDLEIDSSGFTVQFSESLNADVLDLVDLSVRQNSTGNQIAGSLVLTQDNTRVSFISSGAVLGTGSYTVSLNSSETGFISETGLLLDGDSNELPGGDFSAEFIVSEFDRIIGLDDFTLAAGTSADLDISLSDGANITEAEFTLTYNPAVLSVEDLVLDPALAADWEISFDHDTPGIIEVELSGSALTNGVTELLSLEVSIPNNPGNTSADLVRIDHVSLNNNEIIGVGDTALQIITAVGDLNGDGNAAESDAHLASLVAVGLSDRFDAFPTIDPLLVGDLNNDGVISALDGYLLLQS